VQASAAGLPGYLDRAARRIAVSDYLQVTAKISRSEEALNRIYADPAIADKDAAASGIRSELRKYEAMQGQLAPWPRRPAGPVSEVLSDFGLTILAGPCPRCSTTPHRSPTR